MKKSKFSFLFLSAVVFMAIAFFSFNCGPTGSMNGSSTGGSIGLGVNISNQPMWGPTGYDRADYYYIPDIDAYYSVSERQYIYKDGATWVHVATLPSGYSTYDPYHSYKVVVNEDRPYLNNDSHRSRYRTFRGHRDQEVIRDSHDHRYWASKDHPEHDNWVKEQH